MVFAELLIGRVKEAKLRSDVPEIEMKTSKKEKRETDDKTA